MSLLIKALASAEKDKLAEQGKKSSGEYVVDDALILELTPTEEIELGQTDNLAKFVEETSSQKYEKDFDFVLPTSRANELLSLEVEAGLDISKLAPLKQAQSQSKANTQEKRIEEQPNLVNKIVSKSTKTMPIENAQKSVAKVFVANQSTQTPTSKTVLAVLGIAGALILWLGFQGYQYVKSSKAPEIVIAKPLMTPSQIVTKVTDTPAPSTQTLANNSNLDQTVTSSNAPPNPTDLPAVADIHAINSPELNASANENNVNLTSNANVVIAEPVAPKKTTRKKQLNSALINLDKEPEQKKNSIKLISKTPSTGIDPTLLSAYQAFTRGEDASAQQQYRQVLQHDIRNVDALLGMAAIAQRQGRNADAIGWYQKVLEIDPKNTIAQSSVINPESGIDVVTTESRIKNMLAQHPESAHLHAALGNLYVNQNQWSQAQEAYFNACRYAPNNADYAFNMAISLDQMGKASLALLQYQRALELVKKSNLASPDRAVIESRIQTLQ